MTRRELLLSILAAPLARAVPVPPAQPSLIRFKDIPIMAVVPMGQELYWLAEDGVYRVGGRYQYRPIGTLFTFVPDNRPVPPSEAALDA